MVCGICKKEGHNRRTCPFAPHNIKGLDLSNALKEKKKNDILAKELSNLKKRMRSLTNDYDDLSYEYDNLSSDNEQLENYIEEVEHIARGMYEENESLKNSTTKKEVRKLKDMVLEGLEVRLENGLLSEGEYIEKCDLLKE